MELLRFDQNNESICGFCCIPNLLFKYFDNYTMYSFCEKFQIAVPLHCEVEIKIVRKLRVNNESETIVIS